MPAELDVEILPNELAQVVESIFLSMLGLEVCGCETPWFPAEERLTAAVHLSGDWNGALLVECTRLQACHFAGRFLSRDPGDIADEVVRDFLGELANMIGGNIKCVLTRGLHLSMPVVVDGSEDLEPGCSSDLRTRLTFQSEEGFFWVGVAASRS